MFTVGPSGESRLGGSGLCDLRKWEQVALVFIVVTGWAWACMFEIHVGTKEGAGFFFFFKSVCPDVGQVEVGVESCQQSDIKHSW